MSHEKLSYPIVQKWQDIKIGCTVSQLSTLIESKNWYESALIQIITIQTGIWYVEAENGCSVFRIYPFLKKQQEVSVYHGIVIKLDRSNITIDLLIDEVTKNKSPINIIEFNTFGNNLHKYQKAELDYY